MEDSLFTPQGLRINFFIWASRRGLGGYASKRRKQTFTAQRWKHNPLPPRCRAFRYNVFVVFSMRSNKSDKHSTFREPYHNNKAVMIPFDVKHIPIIADIIHIVEHFSDVTQVLPVSLTCNKVPVFQRLS